MAWWARVLDGVVQEPARDLPDGDEPSQYFPDELPGVWTAAPDGSAQSGWTYAGGVYTAPVVPGPTVAQQAEAALMAGLAITSTGTPALDATYHAAGPRWQMMRDEAQYVATFGAFSGGLTTLAWMAASGDVDFVAPAKFLAVTRAIGDWLTLWQLHVDGRSGSSPAASVTIA